MAAFALAFELDERASLVSQSNERVVDFSVSVTSHHTPPTSLTMRFGVPSSEGSTSAALIHCASITISRYVGLLRGP
jgi:hypothetical protein